MFCAAKEVPLGDDRERTDQTLIHGMPIEGFTGQHAVVAKHCGYIQ